MRPPFDIEFALKSIVGTASPVLGVVTSFLEQIEWNLRIASLLVSLAIGVLLVDRAVAEVAAAMSGGMGGGYKSNWRAVGSRICTRSGGDSTRCEVYKQS